MKKDYFPLRGEPRVYAYTEPHRKDTPWVGQRPGKGLLKVGDSKSGVVNRVWMQHPIKLPEAQPFTIEVDELAVDDKGAFFRDHAVHRVLIARGVHRVAGEWFECTKEEVVEAIKQVRQGLSRALTRTQDLALFALRMD